MREKTLATCFPETRFKYKEKHKRSPETRGLCGIKLNVWKDEIPELNKNNVDSLYAGSLVLDYLIEKNDGSFHEALVEYKGAEKNMKTVEKVYDTLRVLKRNKN